MRNTTWDKIVDSSTTILLMLVVGLVIWAFIRETVSQRFKPQRRIAMDRMEYKPTAESLLFVSGDGKDSAVIWYDSLYWKIVIINVNSGGDDISKVGRIQFRP